MSPEVSAFVADRPLPDEESGEEAEIDRRARQLEAIPRPLSLAEAEALAGCYRTLAQCSTLQGGGVGHPRPGDP